MNKSLRDKLREDLEYAEIKGDPTTDEYKIGIKEDSYEVAQDLRYEKVREDVMQIMNALTEKYAPEFGDRKTAMGAILGVIEKLYL